MARSSLLLMILGLCSATSGFCQSHFAKPAKNDQYREADVSKKSFEINQHKTETCGLNSDLRARILDCSQKRDVSGRIFELVTKYSDGSTVWLDQGTKSLLQLSEKADSKEAEECLLMGAKPLQEPKFKVLLKDYEIILKGKQGVVDRILETKAYALNPSRIDSEAILDKKPESKLSVLANALNVIPLDTTADGFFVCKFKKTW